VAAKEVKRGLKRGRGKRGVKEDSLVAWKRDGEGKNLRFDGHNLGSALGTEARFRKGTLLALWSGRVDVTPLTYPNVTYII